MLIMIRIYSFQPVYIFPNNLMYNSYVRIRTLAARALGSNLSEIKTKKKYNKSALRRTLYYSMNIFAPFGQNVSIHTKTHTRLQTRTKKINIILKDLYSWYMFRRVFFLLLLLSARVLIDFGQKW